MLNYLLNTQSIKKFAIMMELQNIKKILIVGYGSIGKKHHLLIKDMFPEVTIKFFRHNISNKNNALDTDLYTMDEVEDFKPEISFICNPASNHIEQAIKLGSIGSHFF